MATTVKKSTKYSRKKPATETDAFKTDKSSTSSSPEPYQDPCSELQHLMHEGELVRVEKGPGNVCIVKRPTERAFLARHGYILGKTIGSGNYSKVKVARDVLGIAGEVAIKIINCSSAPKDFLTRFLPRELEIWGRIKHQHIIRMNCYVKDKGHNKLYMVMEHACNGDLLTLVQSSGAINEFQSRKWIMQLASAVAYLHDHNVTHRDLKLENVLLDCHHNVKICDFGFSKSLGAGELSSTYCGSKAYASPEILLSQPYDPRKADTWALGVIAYIVVTGRMPFDEHVGSNSAIVATQRSLRLTWGRRRLSSACKTLIKDMLSFEYQSRPSLQAVMNCRWFRPRRDAEVPPPSLTAPIPADMRFVTSSIEEGRLELQERSIYADVIARENASLALRA